MAVKHGLGTYGNAVGTVTPEDHKLAQAGLIVKDTTGKIRAGLFYTGTETIVSGKANMSYDVAAFTAALTRGASSGAVLLANDGVVNVVTTAAPGSNSRYDVVYVWQREYSLDGTDSNPVIGVVQGTAAASPSVPSLSAFPGAIELARILVPAGVTATNSGTTITQTAPFTAASGAPVHFRSTTERDAETSLAVGQLGEVSEILYVWDGSAWVLAAIPGLKRHLSQFLTGSGVATGATLGTQAVPSIPIASKLIVRMTGDVGFAGANGSHGVAVTASAGTIDESASTGTTIRTATTTPNWHAYARVVEVAVAASTAVTLTFKADSSVDGHYRIHTDVEVVPAGEY